MEQLNRATVALAALAAIAQEASIGMDDMQESLTPEYSETPPWKQGEYKGGRPKANRGGVTRKSRFHVSTKRLRAEKKNARQRKKK